MAWTSLGISLTNKPRVLAGPILRKVTPTEATVWLGLRKPGVVVLKVLDFATDNRLMEGRCQPAQRGRHGQAEAARAATSGFIDVATATT